MTRRIDRVHEQRVRDLAVAPSDRRIVDNLVRSRKDAAGAYVDTLVEVVDAGKVAADQLRDVLGLPADFGLDFSSSRIRIDEEGQAVQRCPRCGEDRTPSLVGIEAHDLTCRGLQRPSGVVTVVVKGPQPSTERP